VRQVTLPGELLDAGDGAQLGPLRRRVAAEADLGLQLLGAFAGLVDGDVAEPAEFDLVPAAAGVLVPEVECDGGPYPSGLNRLPRPRKERS